MDLEGIRKFIIGMIIVTLIAAAGGIALYDFQTSVRGDKITSAVNISLTLSSNTGTLSESGWFIALSGLRNASMISQRGNCNVSSAAVIVCNTSVNTPIYCDYTYYTPSHNYNITNAGLTGLDNSTGYFGNAGTIAGVALLLVIVIGSFYFITRRTGM